MCVSVGGGGLGSDTLTGSAHRCLCGSKGDFEPGAGSCKPPGTGSPIHGIPLVSPQRNSWEASGEFRSASNEGASGRSRLAAKMDSSPLKSPTVKRPARSRRLSYVQLLSADRCLGGT